MADSGWTPLLSEVKSNLSTEVKARYIEKLKYIKGIQPTLASAVRTLDDTYWIITKIT